MSATASEPAADPTGAQAAIERYRDLAKYIVAIFAGVAGVLVAGIQLTSLGSLNVNDDLTRIIVAGISLIFGLGSVVWVISRALTILRPLEMSLQTIETDPDLTAYVEKRNALLGDLRSVKELSDMIESPLVDRSDLPRWERMVDVVTDVAAVELVRRHFERAWRLMLVGALVGTVAIVAFAVAANPPETAPAAGSHASMAASAIAPAGTAPGAR